MDMERLVEIIKIVEEWIGISMGIWLAGSAAAMFTVFGIGESNRIGSSSGKMEHFNGKFSMLRTADRLSMVGPHWDGRNHNQPKELDRRKDFHF